MAFTVFWKVFIIIYMVLSLPFMFCLIRFPDIKPFKKIREFDDSVGFLIAKIIMTILWIIMSIIIIRKLVLTPSSDYLVKTQTVTKTEKEYVYRFICEDCDECLDKYIYQKEEDEWEKEWEAEHNKEKDEDDYEDDKYDNIWGE